MMKRIFFGICLFMINVLINGQQDSIYINAKIHSDLETVEVQQSIILNINDKNTKNIKLLNWISAYKNSNTQLAKRTLENRNKNLHFAKKEELGNLKQLKVKIGDSIFTLNNQLNDENLTIPLPSAFIGQNQINLDLNYTLKLPSAQFTGYGKEKDEALLKYFFLVPDHFKNELSKGRKYQNIEETANYNTYWKVNLEVPANFYSKSNLPEITPHTFEGSLNEDITFLISKNNYPSILSNVDNQPVLIDLGYPITYQQLDYLEFFIPLQLQFIKERIGKLPSKIFISKKNEKEEDFFGNDDIKFLIYRFPMFSFKENTDLDYFSILSKRTIEQLFISNKEEHHGIINGIKTYLEIEYLKKYYSNRPLLGDLPDVDIYGIQPLKWFHASKLKLVDRYNLGYRYMMTRNLDQKINEKFSELSNLNNLAISHFESGRALHYISEKMGKDKFHQFLSDYIQKNSNEPLDKMKFINEINNISNNEFAFLVELLNHKHRINFKIKKEKSDDESIAIKIKHNLPKGVPYTLESLDNMGRKKIYWLKTKAENGVEHYKINNNQPMKLIVNSSMYLSERNYRDNYLYPHSFIANIKKIKFNIFKDIENPEFNEIYLNPRLSFNAYDKVLLGINFSNSSFLDKKFNYSLTPYYSTGTNKITGSGSLIYRIMPIESFLQKISFGVSGSYFHYDYDNAYNKATIYTSFLFRKKNRSSINQQLTLSFNHFNKDLPLNINPESTYLNYNLFNVNYGYVDDKLIHEKSFGVNYQVMSDFQKLSAQAFYRYEFAKNKKLSIRWFGGYFIDNRTKNNVFNFGLSKISNYDFTYGLLGQSATSGLLSQQYVLADGGFKSYVADDNVFSTANEWITSVNSDVTIWKLFHLYGDIGFYKNKNSQSKFVWDSGVNLRLIPDFLEIYFPVYSNLGFEPQFKDYAKRIRFTLVFDFQSITNAIRRGWY